MKNKVYEEEQDEYGPRALTVFEALAQEQQRQEFEDYLEKIREDYAQEYTQKYL